MYIPADGRYEAMTYSRSGESGLMLPKLSLGFWHNFGDTADMDTMRALCRTAFDHGICHFDLADNYGPPLYRAEEHFAQIYRKDFVSHRDELLIATKAGHPTWKGPYGDWGGRKHLLASLDRSLQRMGLEYVDIFYHHRMDPGTPLEETMEALAQMVRSGKALYIGLSKYDAPTLERASAILRELHCPFVVNQLRYNLLERTVERDGTIDTAIKEGKGVMAFTPFAQGLLTERYLSAAAGEATRRSDGLCVLREEVYTDDRRRQILELGEIAHQRGQTLQGMALSWVMQQRGVSSVVMGASRPEQILENLEALKHTDFTSEELQRIDALT